MYAMLIIAAAIALGVASGDLPTTVDPAPVANAVPSEETLEPAGTCGESDADPAFAPPAEKCLLSVCSGMMEVRCILLSGTSCQGSNKCYYSTEWDPTCSTQGPIPSCAVGCPRIE